MSNNLHVKRYHACGFPLYIDRTWNGIDWTMRFMNGDETSRFCSCWITECPKCEEPIYPRDVRSESEAAI